MVYKNGGKKRLQKRWYLDASIGKGVPLIGGTSLRAGTGLQKRSLTAQVKDIVRKGIEVTKYKIFSGNTTQVITKHNNMYVLNLMGNIPRGTSVYNREGDTVFISAIELYFTMYMNYLQDTINDVNVKWWIIKSDEQIANASDVPTINTTFYNSSRLNTPRYKTHVLFDPRNTTVMKSGSHVIKPQLVSQPSVGARVSSASIKTDRILVCPQHKFTYSTGTNFAKHLNYYLVFTTAAAEGVDDTTNTGVITVDGQVKFKDSQ